MLESIFHGHAFVEIRYDQGSILIDPFITGNETCDISVDDAKALQPLAIVVTHGHADHIGDTIEIAKETGCLVISTFEVNNWLSAQGVENLSAQHIGGMVDYESYRIKFTPALHGGQIAESEITGVAAGVLVMIDQKTIYHAGDTGLSQEMKLLGEFEEIDLAFLPI